MRARSGGAPGSPGTTHRDLRPRRSRVPTATIWRGWSNGRSLNSAALMNVNTVLLAAIPSASATTAATVNRRSFASRRVANWMSCAMSCSHGQIQTSRARFCASAALPNARVAAIAASRRSNPLPSIAFWAIARWNSISSASSDSWRRRRIAYRSGEEVRLWTLLAPQGDHRIDAGRAPSGDVAGGETRHGEHSGYTEIRHRIEWA